MLTTIAKVGNYYYPCSCKDWKEIRTRSTKTPFLKACDRRCEDHTAAWHSFMKSLIDAGLEHVFFHCKDLTREYIWIRNKIIEL